MPDLPELLHQIARLSPEERDHLRRALGESRGADLPLFQFGVPQPHSAEWVRSETGHAVVAQRPALSAESIPQGPDAIAGIWADREAL